MEKKAASDILLELQEKIDTILGYVKTNDLNNKLILDRLNKFITNKSVVISSSMAKTETQIEKPISSSVLVPKPVADQFIFHDVDENNNAIIQEELQPAPGRRDIRVQAKITGKKTQVSQKVFYDDGKNLILANIMIFDAQQKLIKQTRTNSSGKWLAVLDPGKYTIKIYKAPTSNKPLVERQYEVDIPISDVPLEL